MFYWIYDIPNWQLAVMISGGFVLIYWFGAIFLSPILRRLVRSTSGSNDVVGYILSSFGVFYGLLLGIESGFQSLSGTTRAKPPLGAP